MKKCNQCDGEMEITLRKIHFNKNKLEIKNVPVYTCEKCEEFTLIEQVEVSLRNIVTDKRIRNGKKFINFENYSELSQLLMILFNEQVMSLDTEELEYKLRELLEWDKISDYVEESIEKVIHKNIAKHVH